MPILKKNVGKLKKGIIKIIIQIIDVLSPPPTPNLSFTVDSLIYASSTTATSFDGSDDYLYKTGALSSTYPFSVALWFKSTGNGDAIWGQFGFDTGTHGNYLYFNSTTLGAYSDQRSGGYTSGGATATVSADEWHFVVATWESTSSRKLSVDGGAFVTDTTSIALQAAVSYTMMGAYGTLGFTSDYLEGAIDNVGVWGKALTDEDVAALYNDGKGVNYNGLSDTLLEDLISWHDMSQSAGSRLDSHSSNDFSVGGAPGSIVGIVKNGDAPSIATNGNRVSKVGDGIAENHGPIFYNYPNRLVADASGAGVKIADKAFLVAKEFDLFFSAEDFFGNAGRLFFSDDGMGTKAGLDVDASGFLSYHIENADSSATFDNVDSAFGMMPVVGGSASSGRVLTNLRLFSNERLDARPGDRMTVFGCGDTYDRELAVILGYHWDEINNSGILRYQAESGNIIGDPPLSGYVILHGRYEESADQRSTDPEISWCAGFRVKRKDSRVDIYRNNFHLGGGNLSTSIVGNSDLGFTMLGTSSGDSHSPTLNLPNRAVFYDGEVADRYAIPILAEYCRRPRCVDAFAGEVYRERIECLPNVWRQDMAHTDIRHLIIDDSTEDIVDGPSWNGDQYGISEGVGSATSLGDFFQTGITNYTYEVHTVSRAWNQDGSRATQSYLHSSSIAATRRPWEKQLYVDCVNGDSSNDGSEDFPFDTIGAAVSAASPGTLIRVVPTGTYPPFTISNAPHPLAIVSTDGNPWDVYGFFGGITQSTATLTSTRGLTVKDMRVVHRSDEDFIFIAVPIQGSVGLSLLNITESNQGSTHKGDIIYANAPTDDIVIHDYHVESGIDYIGYPIFLGASTRGLSVRRARIERPIGSGQHVSRIYSQVYGEYAGVTYDAPIPPGWPQATVGMRASICRTTIRDCWAPDRQLSLRQMPRLGGDFSAYDPGGTPVIQVGILCTRNTFFSFDVTVCAESRFTNNWIFFEKPGPVKGGGDPLFEPDVQLPTTGSVIMEGNAGSSFDHPGDIVMAMPLSGNRRNIVTTDWDTGESIVAPEWIALDTNLDDRVVLVMDGLPLGGLTPLSGTTYLDNVALGGSYTPCVVAIAESGAHTISVDIWDDNNDSATGTSLDFTL